MRPAQDIVASLGLEPLLAKSQARRPATPGSDAIAVRSREISAEHSQERSSSSPEPPPATMAPIEEFIEQSGEAVELGGGKEVENGRRTLREEPCQKDTPSATLSPPSLQPVTRLAAAGFSNRCGTLEAVEDLGTFQYSDRFIVCISSAAKHFYFLQAICLRRSCRRQRAWAKEPCNRASISLPVDI